MNKPKRITVHNAWKLRPSGPSRQEHKMNINQTAEVMSAGPLAVATPELCQPILILHASFKQLTLRTSHPIVPSFMLRDLFSGTVGIKNLGLGLGFA